MKRIHLAYALACLLAGAAAPALAQTPAGVADPQAAVPATTYQPAIRPDAVPSLAASPDQAWRAANATVGGRNAMSLTMPGMGGAHDMSGHDNGMQCMAGGGGKGCCGGKCCCGDKPAAGEHAGHAGHAGMAMDHGCCDHKEGK